MGDMSDEMESNSEGDFEEDSEDSGEIAELPTQHEMKKDLI
jgi:hypothetical protein